MAFRPGLPLLVLGLLLGLLAFLPPPGSARATATPPGRHPAAVLRHRPCPLAVQYLAWLGYVLFARDRPARAGRGRPAAAGARLGRRRRGRRGRACSRCSPCTRMSALAAAAKAPRSRPADLVRTSGTGGWLACIALFTHRGRRAWSALPSGRDAGGARGARRSDARRPTIGDRLHQRRPAPPRCAASPCSASRWRCSTRRPPRQFWQQALVTDIGVYVLLAIGLNVVIGWAGLLDLGYIAFYAIGSYTTAYLTGSLPIKPPSLAEPARRCGRSRSRSWCASSRECCSAHRRCGCAVTTWPSSPSASARSSGSSRSTTPATSPTVPAACPTRCRTR